MGRKATECGEWGRSGRPGFPWHAMRQDPACREALSNVWCRGMPDEVRARVQAASDREGKN